MNYKIHCLNNISEVGLKELKSNYQLTDQIADAHAILVRSAVMHDMKLEKEVLAVARAGAGVNNIPLDLYAKQGIVCFNTPGANANAVKELTLAGMLLASRDIFGGMTWLKENQKDPEIQKTIEKKKSAFGGTEIFGKTIGIIGLGGAIGFKIAEACTYLGMNVLGVEANMNAPKLKLLPSSVKVLSSLEEMLPLADFVSINVPLFDSTKHMMNKQTLKLMKKGSVLLNFARDLLVNDDDLEEALVTDKIRLYVTDFPNLKTASMEKVIAIPHLGASTEEAEDNCAIMAVEELQNYMEVGSIINSVNYPNLIVEPKNSNERYQILFTAEEDQLDSIYESVKLCFPNLVSFNRAYKKGYGYIVVDSKTTVSDLLIEQLKEIKGMIRVRHM